MIMILEIYKTTEIDHYIELAEVIEENIVDEHYLDRYFLPTKKLMYARFNSPEPLVQLDIIAIKQGISHLVPAYLTGTGETDGEKFIEVIEVSPSDSQKQ